MPPPAHKDTSLAFGGRLDVAVANASDRASILAALQQRRVYAALSLPRPPTAEEFASERLLLAEDGETTPKRCRMLALRLSGGEEPGCWGFFLEYGWDGVFDTARELDLAICANTPRSPGLALEAHLRGAAFFFAHRWGRFLRFRVRGRRHSPSRWYARYGVRHIHSDSIPDAPNDEMHVYELDETSFVAALQRRGLGAMLR